MAELTKDKKNIILELKQKCLELGEHYEANLKIECNLNVEQKKIKINITEYSI